jgi:hypothetical protein
MAHFIPTTKLPRRGTLYSQEEILVISKYKAEYKEQTTRPLRANVLRNKILVDLFNHWDAQKTLPLDEAAAIERVKVKDQRVKCVRLENLTTRKFYRNLLPGCGITGARLQMLRSLILP